MPETKQEVRVIRATKGHYYEITFREGQEDQAADVVARWANDPRLPFTWRDADLMGDEIREL